MLRTHDQPRRPGMISAIPAAQISLFSEHLRADCAALGLSLDDAQQQKLLAFLNHLLHWNALINLSAVTDPAEMLTVLIVDSLAALPVLRQNCAAGIGAISVLDVGSGAGLPAVPWAIALPEAQIVAVDSVRKKIDTVTEFVSKHALANVKGEHLRIQDVKSQYDIVTSRAFSSLKNFVDQAGSCVVGGGVMLALKGKSPDDEIAELAQTAWAVREVVPLKVPRLEAERCVVVLRRR